MGEKHKEAFAFLRYGVLANKGFLLLTGDVGTGKTTLINALVESFGKDVIIASVSDPGLEPLDFFNFVARAFNINKTFAEKAMFLLTISDFLKICYKKGKKVLLIIDEAQRLSSKLLEEIRLLSNIEEAHTKLINIFFVGQNEFNKILLENKNRALRQRISLNHTLEALNETEVRSYIQHRLNVAGSKREIFDGDAVKEIYAFSGGYPRLVNIICDHALLTGYVKEKKKISAKIIKECAGELRLSLESYESETDKPKVKVNKVSKIDWFPRKKLHWRKFAYSVVLILLFVIVSFFSYRAGRVGPATAMKDYWRQAISVFRRVPVTAHNDNQRIGHGNQVEPGTTFLNDKARNHDPDLLRQPKEAISKPEKSVASEHSGLSTNVVNTTSLSKVEELSNKTIDADSLSFPLFILFENNSYKITNTAAEKLDRLVENLNKKAYSKITVRGYTDGTGKYDYNKKLSESRANSVKRYLEKKGISPLNINTYGMGPEVEPRTTGLITKGQMSRRVEIELY